MRHINVVVGRAAVNGSMDKLLRASMSSFPISRKVPPSTIIRQLSSRRVPVREFRTMSTPMLLVRLIIWVAKSVVLDEKM